MTTALQDRSGTRGHSMELGLLLAQAGLPGLVDSATGPLSVRAIRDDSRQVEPGSLFVAVPGTRADGARFISDAVGRGAVAVVADRASRVEAAVPLVRVGDVRQALARIGAVFLGLREVQAAGGLAAIGVTGTNGKSTFAYMMRALLREAGHVAALLGTIEYDLVGRRLPSSLTTPDALSLTQHLMEAHRAGATHVVMEVSSHSLDQRRTDGIRFRAAVFTNLTQDHLDYHETLDRYLQAKRRLFEGLDGEATAILNGHDPASASLIEGCRARLLRYGLAPGCDVRGTILAEDRLGGRFLLAYDGRRLEMRTPMVGRHNILNALAAAAAGLSCGLDLDTIRSGLTRLESVPGRLERVPTGESGFDVFVDYAHTDDALRNVLTAVRPLTAGRLWCVFGCGGDRDRTKRPKMARAVADHADRFVVTSDNPRSEEPARIIEDILSGLGPAERSRAAVLPDRAEAIAHAIDGLAAGDCLVIAGKGHEDYQIVGDRKLHFDDVEVAGAAIRARTGGGACRP